MLPSSARKTRWLAPSAGKGTVAFLSQCARVEVRVETHLEVRKGGQRVQSLLRVRCLRAVFHVLLQEFDGGVYRFEVSHGCSVCFRFNESRGRVYWYGFSHHVGFDRRTYREMIEFIWIF